jgi:acyl-lipid omega-6 desaturase (Delta-12 desaturase)
MENTIKKSDFVLIPYMKSNDLRATYQIINTVIPYILLWILAFKVAPISYWLLPPIMTLIVLFSLRCFSLMHDCGHYSLFTSKKVNRIFGFLLGIINAMPQYSWSRDHAYHHKTNGDWERYRGVADFISTEEFSNLTPFNQRLYQVLRHPLMAIPGGFFYLAIKPRLALIIGVYDLIMDIINSLKKDSTLKVSEIIANHQSKHWQSKEEFWDLLLNNIFVISGWIILSYVMGAAFFLTTYSITLTFSAAIFINIFFVQHIFEDSYAHKTETWDYIKGAIEGSSYLKLPTILNWFTADIGYHNIHHLSERIPNYNLEACHYKNIHLLSKVKTVRIQDMLGCSKFILWDSNLSKLVSVESYRQRVSLYSQQNMEKSLA